MRNRSRSAWSRLEQAFENKGLAMQIGLLHKLLRLTMECCTSMQEEYVNEVVATFKQINSLDFKIPSPCVGMLLLAGIPKQFEPWCWNIPAKQSPRAANLLSISKGLFDELHDAGC